MNTDIKQRINQIQNGEIPQGYKMSKLGIIPNEWKDVKAGSLFDNYCDRNHDGNLLVLSSTQDKGIVPREELDIDIKYEESNLVNYKKALKGNFIISLRSFQGGIEFSNYTGLVSPAYTVLKAKKEICDEFFKYLFKTDMFISRLNSTIYGIRDGKQIKYSDFTFLRLYYPLIAEQRKIATILSTQDKVIELKETLLAEKKRQKKYLMQVLLNPDSVHFKRLPGFSGEWKKVRLGKICTMFSGGTPKSTNNEYYKGGIPFIRSAEISKNETELMITSAAFSDSSAKMVNKGDLLYALYGANSGECAISKIEGAINQAILCIRCNQASLFYIYYLLVAEKEQIITAYLQGGQGNLSAQIIKNISICLPPKYEQIKIQDILYSFDENIKLIEGEIDSEKQKKKALMQLLLTGKVRVKV